MSETVIVRTEPETDPQPELTERTLGRLEAETEHLEEATETLSNQIEDLEQATETATDRAEQATETAWDAKAEVERLRSEIQADLAEIRAMIADSDGDEDGLENQIEEIELPMQAEPVEAAPAERSMISKILFG